ncbi:hypothetical protein KVR01_008491 [Diaporthe batatas]|uniref:uncharacterized protein n=1 Tax=Diaporthe batatas TaxID=748121 RepID=UPI001D056381|nr:uncharacterized protein KVR01_008491 [Diaporthe batatas]KAG8161504.1 hypothetical protein KVR01_008491 [Diaporthe batatas]
MSDDDDREPQGPFNRFIRFKNHVNSHISAGVSVLTGSNDDANKPPVGDATAGSSSPGPKRQSPMAEYWEHWYHVDPYSPHNLRHLPQPTPNDLPPGADPAHFGYPEAFEDLMSASNSSRGNLMDLDMRAALKRSASGAQVTPETPSAWVRRLYGDALLPHPFMWEHPNLAGRIPKHWEAHIRDSFQTQRTPGHDQDSYSDIAKDMLDTIRRLEGNVAELFSKMDEPTGQDVADTLRKVQSRVEDVMRWFSEGRSTDQDPSDSHAESQGNAEAAPVSQEDQPATEQDLFEFIQSASASVDRLLKDVLKSSPGQAPPPPERPSRDNPSVSETVEHHPSGGKTIRTSSEHVDMFGFVHCRTEVRRLNAEGETIDYDTRYSVRSGPRDDRPPLQEYRPRSAASVPWMTPAQYSAFLSRSSDEQLEAFMIATAEAVESGLDPIKNHQMRLIQQEQERRANSKPRPGSQSQRIQDYYQQLMLMEQQNKERLREAAEAEFQSTNSGKPTPDDEDYTAPSQDQGGQNEPRPAGINHARQDYMDQLRLIQEYNIRKGWTTARAEAGSDRPEGQEEQLSAARGDQNRRRPAARGKEEVEARPPPEKPEGSTNSERSGWFWR